jgi:hypothetical protein
LVILVSLQRRLLLLLLLLVLLVLVLLLLLLLLLSLSLVLLLIQPLHGHPTGNMNQTLMHVKQVKNGLRI